MEGTLSDIEPDIANTPEARLERALLILEEASEVVMRYHEERGGQGPLLKKIQKALE